MIYVAFLILALLLPVSENFFFQLGIGSLIIPLFFLSKREEHNNLIFLAILIFGAFIFDSVNSEIFGGMLIIVFIIFSIRDILSFFIDLESFWKAMILDFILLFFIYFLYYNLIDMQSFSELFSIEKADFLNSLKLSIFGVIFLIFFDLSSKSLKNRKNIIIK